VKIDFCSDLHVDAWHGTTQLHDPTHRRWMGEPHESTFLYLDWAQYRNPDSRVLVIAGDTSNSMMTTKEVIEAAAAEYEYVIVVDGNHEHYSDEMTVENAMQFLAEELSRLPNVYYLDSQNSLILDGVAFFGATAWYDFEAYADRGISSFMAQRAWNSYSNDSRYPDFGKDSPLRLAMTQSLNLADQVRGAQNDANVESIVMVTHMSPRADLMEWKDNNPVWNALTPSYVNTCLDQVIKADTNKKIKGWIYGHTHQRQMVEKDGVVYANNARGYPRENPPFTLTQLEISSK
jgi:UDP-2,3-diacylglucosamine pyrophosphatase LpxH